MGSNNKGGQVKFGQILKVGSLAGQTLIKVMANKVKRVIKCVQKWNLNEHPKVSDGRVSWS